MRGSNFQLICWTLTFFLEFLVCDARILRGESEHLKVPSTFHFSQARGKVQVSQGLVTVNPNAEVLATTEQSGDTELVEETNVPIVDDGGKTAAVVSQARGKVQVSQGLVTVNPNAEVLATTEQSGDTELVEETNIPIVDDGGTAAVVEAYNGEGSVDGQVHQISNGQEPVDHLGQPQVISDMPPIIEEPHTEITISAQYYPGVVCHYQVGTLFFYDDAYKVQPEQITVQNCNTLVASYAILNIDTFTIQAYSVEEEAIFLRLTELKNVALKVILEFEIMAYYGTMVDLLTNKENIAVFVSSVISYLLAFGFDGLQLPAIIPDNTQEIEGQDFSHIKEGYLYLVQELSNAFSEYDLILSVSLPRQPIFIEIAYNLQEMINYVAFFYLISLDYNNNDNTGYLSRTAPLTAERFNDDSYVDYSVNFLLREMNIPPYFIVMALPMYGSTLILQDPNNRRFGDEYIDIGPPGPGAHISGILILSELCSLRNTDWPLNDNTIIDYEDVPEIVGKVLYARTKQLAGVGIMSITMDDPRGDLCGFGPMPFTAIISKAFNANRAWSCQNLQISLENMIDPFTTNKYTG